MGKINKGQRATRQDKAFGPKRGVMPVLQYALPAQLQIDPSYQRSIESYDSQALIRKIAMKWDWDLCLPLVVSRRGDGSLYVIDGQHRLAAARLRGDIEQLPCVVGNYADAAQEAAAFTQINQQRRALGTLDLFRAALTGGDDEAIDIYRAMEAARLSLAPHTNWASWQPGQVCQIGAIRKAWRKWGSVPTSAALDVLAQAWAGKVLAYAGTLFPGIAMACADALARDGRITADWRERFILTLGRHTQDWWRAEILRARGDDPSLTPDTSAEFVIGRVGSGKMDVPAPIVPQPAMRIAAPASAPRSAVRDYETISPPLDRIWCEQCERQVSGAQAFGCKSQFCKAKPKVAA